MHWYRLLRKDVDSSLSEDHLKSFATIKNDVLKATTNCRILVKPGQQYVNLCKILQ